MDYPYSSAKQTPTFQIYDEKKLLVWLTVKIFGDFLTTDALPA